MQYASSRHGPTLAALAVAAGVGGGAAGGCGGGGARAPPGGGVAGGPLAVTGCAGPCTYVGVMRAEVAAGRTYFVRVTNAHAPAIGAQRKEWLDLERAPLDVDGVAQRLQPLAVDEHLAREWERA